MIAAARPFLTGSQPMKAVTLTVSALLSAFVVFLACPAAAGSTSPATVASTTAASVDRARATMNRRVFDTVWTQVRRHYYDRALHHVDWDAARSQYRPLALAATDDTQLYDALGRMMALLDDAHANVQTPAAARRQDAQRRRRAVLGITFFLEGEGIYRIERVRAGSPAEEAGVKPGWRFSDRGEDGWPPDSEVVAGRVVHMRFTDPDDGVHQLAITPREMDPVPVFVADASRPDVLVLRVESFEPGLGHWLGRQLSDISPDTDVILDFRSNPGGLLAEADAVLSCFLPDRQVWATRTGRSGRPVTMRVTEGCGEVSTPLSNDLAVLVDGASRSAAELTPAALQEAGRALVVGRRTGGAVLISRRLRLPDGGRLSLSWYDFHTSGGVRLEKRGVAPDIEVADAETQTSDDPILTAAIAALAAERTGQTAMAATATN